MVSTASVLSARDVSKTYLMESVEVPALTDIHLEVASGEFLALAGSSGSGKTTLLNLFGGLDVPSSGEIFIDGVRAASLSDDVLSEFRSERIGFVFQTFNLLPVLTALENVEYPLRLLKVPAEQRAIMAREALSRVGLEKHMSHRPGQMSGGQRQRVAIARALVKKPRVILADEPTANLDKKTAQEILGLMQELNRVDGITFVFSTHDQAVLKMATRVFWMSDGRHVPGMEKS